MSMIFQNAVALRTRCLSEFCDDRVQCVMFDHNEALRDRLANLIDIAGNIKKQEPDFYWFDLGDFTAVVISRGIRQDLEDEIVEQEIVYVPGLVLPDDCSPRVDYMIMRVDETSVKWRFCLKHEEVNWESVRFNREAISSYLSPVRVVVDRWKEGHRGVQTAQT